MTHAEAVAIVEQTNPALAVQDQDSRTPHLLAIQNDIGTTNYDVRTLDEEILRSLVTPVAA